jgi:hypothetical protein
MEKIEIISNLKVIYQKMKDDFVIRRKIPTHEVESSLEDYGKLIEILETNEWHNFGTETLNIIGAIQGKYFGKGEYVNAFCPKIISYQESHKAQNSLDALVGFIRRVRD